MSEKKKILVVEDEQDVREYLTALFEDYDYEIVSADNGITGLELAGSEKPDLITLDLAMPDQSGVRTYRQCKTDEAIKDTPVIMITGVGDEMQTYLKKLKGFPEPEGFMNKPIDREKLIEMVRALLA